MKNDLKNNIAFTNARLIDPHSGLDEIGDLITEGKQIKTIGKNLFPDGTPENTLIIFIMQNFLVKIYTPILIWKHDGWYHQ